MSMDISDLAEVVQEYHSIDETIANIVNDKDLSKPLPSDFVELKAKRERLAFLISDLMVRKFNLKR